MKELEEAFKSQDFSKILELTKDKGDLPSKVYRLNALIFLKKYASALSLLIENRDEFYKADPIKTIEANFSLRFALNQYDEAYDDVDIFSDYPYVSQEVEEELRKLPKLVRNAEKSYLRRNSKKEIDLSLNQNESALLENLDRISDKDIPSHLNEIRNVVSSLGKDSARTYALMLLVAGKDQKEIKFIKNDSEFDVIPSELEIPFSGNTHLRFVNKVQEECKDPSLSDVALSLYSNAYIAAYPEPLLEEGKISDYVSAFIDIAREYLKQDDIAPCKIDPEVLLRVKKFLDAAK